MTVQDRRSKLWANCLCLAWIVAAPAWGHPHDYDTTLAAPLSAQREAAVLADEDLAVAGEAAEALGRMFE